MRRAPVQADYTNPPRGKAEPGTISWEEHVEAWSTYRRHYGEQQSAERIAERQGFSYLELCELLGHEPQTWEPWWKAWEANEDQ